MKSKISICFLTIVVILLALVMIEKINTQRAADKAAIIAQSNENDKEERNEKETILYDLSYYCDFFSDAVSGCKKRISKSEKGNGTAKCDTAGCTSGCKKYFKAEKI